MTAADMAPSWAADPVDADSPEPVYPNVEAWVTEFFCQVLQRQPKSTQVGWCPQWRAHPEAVHRLTALWRSWEALQADPVNISTWWVHHLDPHSKVLLDAEHGPFSKCGGEAGHTNKLQPLPEASKYADLGLGR